MRLLMRLERGHSFQVKYELKVWKRAHEKLEADRGMPTERESQQASRFFRGESEEQKERLREAHVQRAARYMVEYSEEWRPFVREAYLRETSGWIPVTRYFGLLDDLIDENEELERKFARVRRRQERVERKRRRRRSGLSGPMRETYHRERRSSWKFRRELGNGLQCLV